MDQKKERFLRLGARVAFVFAAGVVFFACPRPGFSVTVVGLGAPGVDVAYSLNNSFHLDMRDALGRPVSSNLVQEQLKTLAAQSRAKIEFFSSLPKAKAISFFLECLWTLSSATLAHPLSWPFFDSLWALPAPKRQDLGVWTRVLFALFQIAGVLSFVCAVSFYKETSHRDFSLLRC